MPVNGSSFDPATVEAVDPPELVNGSADDPLPVEPEDAATCGAIVVLVDVVVVGFVVVDVVDVVDVVVVELVDVVVVEVDVVVVVSQPVMAVRMPTLECHGKGTRMASAWITPQKSGYATLSTPDRPETSPTSGLPGAFGSLT